MKSTLLHSVALVVGAAAVLLACFALVHPTAHVGIAADRSDTLRLWSPPMLALSQLLPGVVLGWFTRRHPLVVGAFAGILAMLAARALGLGTLDSYAFAGETVAAGMTVAVAALAGRALQRRFSATNSTPAAAR